MNSRRRLSVFPARRLPGVIAGCRKRNGRGGTRNLRPTLRLEDSISWCVRPRKRRPRGISRTCKCIAPRRVSFFRAGKVVNLTQDSLRVLLLLTHHRMIWSVGLLFCAPGEHEPTLSLLFAAE